MALPTWPTGVPYDPDRSSFVHQRTHAPLVVTEVEDGPEIMREQSQTRIKKIPYRLAMDEAQAATLIAFFDTTLSQGKAHFVMPVLDSMSQTTFNNRRVYLEKGEWAPELLADGMWTISFLLNVFPYE